MNAATITVTSPHAADTWYKKGSTYNITWNSTDISASTNMKINIFKDAINTENFVEQLLSTNDHTESWHIGTGYATGTYYIRIKTEDNTAHGDSGAFTIKSRFAFKPITKPKFKVKPNLSNMSPHYEQFENDSIEMILQRITIYYGDQTLNINNGESKAIHLPEDSSLITGSGKISLRIEYTLRNKTNKNFRFHVAVTYGTHVYGSKLITFLGSKTHVITHDVELPGANTYLPIRIGATDILVDGGANDVTPIYFSGNFRIRIYPL